MLINYKRSVPEGKLYRLTRKKVFTPPLISRRKEIEEYILCTKDGFLPIFFSCKTKAHYCPTNCNCDQVCIDSACVKDCVPNCRCDSNCYDCSDDYFCRYD